MRGSSRVGALMASEVLTGAPRDPDAAAFLVLAVADPGRLVLAVDHHHVAHVDGSLLRDDPRSEEHTSELQSRQYLVCRPLFEKKKMWTTATSSPFSSHSFSVSYSRRSYASPSTFPTRRFLSCFPSLLTSTISFTWKPSSTRLR